MNNTRALFLFVGLLPAALASRPAVAGEGNLGATVFWIGANSLSSKQLNVAKEAVEKGLAAAGVETTSWATGSAASSAEGFAGACKPPSDVACTAKLAPLLTTSHGVLLAVKGKRRRARLTVVGFRNQTGAVLDSVSSARIRANVLHGNAKRVGAALQADIAAQRAAAEKRRAEEQARAEMAEEEANARAAAEARARADEEARAAAEEVPEAQQEEQKEWRGADALKLADPTSGVVVDDGGSDEKLFPLIVGLEVGSSFSQAFSELGTSAAPTLEIGYLLPVLDQHLEIQIQLSYIRPHYISNNTDPRLTQEGYRFRITEEELTTGLGAVYRFFAPKTQLNFYAQLIPHMRWQRSTVQGNSEGSVFLQNQERKAEFGVLVGGGVEFTLGPGALAGELNVPYGRYRQTVTGEATAGGVILQVGYHLMF